METTVKIPEFIKTDKEFILTGLPFPVKVKYVSDRTFGKEPKPRIGWPTISQFGFSCDPRFSSFTKTGYRSHFFQTQALLKYRSVEEGAKELVLLLIKGSDPEIYTKIIKGNYNVQLSLF